MGVPIAHVLQNVPVSNRTAPIRATFPVLSGTALPISTLLFEHLGLLQETFAPLFCDLLPALEPKLFILFHFPHGSARHNTADKAHGG